MLTLENVFFTKALKENRQKAYEDFFAVAEHLIEKGVALKKYSVLSSVFV